LNFPPKFLKNNFKGVGRDEIVVVHYVIKPPKSGRARAHRPHPW